MPRMLSSQPKRSWGDDSDDENARPHFELTADEWPPTPPKPRPAKVAKPSTSAGPSGASSQGKASAGGSSGFTRPIVSKPAQAAAAASAGPSSRPLAPKPSFTKQPTGKGKLAPIFQQTPAASSSSSASRQPVASTSRAGSAAYAFNNPASASSTGSVLPKKRSLPWEELESGASRSTRAGSANFHELSGPGGSSKLATGLKGRMLTCDSMDIKQKVVLSPEQQMVLKLVVEDEKSVFFTGSAGTGKSVLLREIIASLKRKYRGNTDAVAVTASTGMAACNIGGTTIHSFASIGLGVNPVEQLIANIRKNRNSVAKWSRTKVLVIDEVSMVDGALFDKLAKIGETLKKSKSKTAPTKPFGGIQLVVTGDFFQLPPVAKGEPTFAFEAAAWKKCIDHTVNLTQVFRQKDTEFIDMLNEMRFGRLTQASIAKFRALSRQPRYTDGVEPTELFPMRHDVDRANQNRLRALPGEETVFKAEDNVTNLHPGADKKENTYLKNFMAVEQLVLKVGAQVMLIKNLDTTLVNGTVGTVVGFGVQELQESDDEDGEDWKLGQHGEQVRSVKPELSAVDARKKQKIVEQIASGKLELGPVVDWQTPLGIERKIMVREEFKVEDQAGNKLASRKQYPVILAWAMSIHKSQGQTINRVKVDLGKVFEKGQSYVALSRATSLEGLQILRFDEKKVQAHRKVIEWSRDLQVLA